MNDVFIVVFGCLMAVSGALAASILIKLLADVHQTLGIPIERFFMKGSFTYKDETIRKAITSQFTSAKRTDDHE